MKNGVATLENSLAAPQNVKLRVTIQPSNFTTRLILKRKEKTGPYKTCKLVSKCS